VRRIVIIGGGFAGAAAAIKIIAGSSGRLELAMVEPRERLGRGIAYATENRDHLVNGLAGAFGLHPEDPGHLVRWLEERADELGWTPPAGTPYAASSPPRAVFGAYVEHELDRAIADAGERLRFVHLRDRAIDFDGDVVTLASGARLAGDQIVLATGLFRKEPAFVTRALAQSPAYVRDVFDTDALTPAAGAKHVLLLGSGLTMLDAVISLEARGFRGAYTAVSRRGLLVQARREAEPWPDRLADGPPPKTARDVLRRVQRERRQLVLSGEDWQRLPPLFRQYATTIWRELDTGERAKLVRHLGPFWNLAQHRAAVPSFAVLDRVRGEGRFQNLAATVTALEPTGSGVRATLRPRGERQALRLDVDLVVNGFGFEFDWNRLKDPLVRNLVTKGYAVPHPLGSGVRADPGTLALVGRNGRVSTRLFAVGHALRAEMWEASSIREQLDHAIRLAKVLNRAGSMIGEAA
jgi:uncharacterized NAD(P)/FAD-binding protein YdhS